MNAVSGELIPGIIALFCGILFAIRWRNIAQSIFNSHYALFSVELNRFSILFVHIMIWFMTISLILAGIFMMFRYFYSI